MERNLNSDKAKRKKREENRFLSAMGTKTHAYHYKIINSIALQEPNHIDTIKAFHHFLSIVTEALFQSVTGIQQSWGFLSKDAQDWHLCYQNSLLKTEIIIGDMLKGKNGSNLMASMKSLPPFQYSLCCPHSHMAKMEKKRVV